MTGDLLEIGHQTLRVAEYKLVDALEDELFPDSVVVRVQEIGVVNVPDFKQLRAGKTAGYGELGKDLP
jgi:hypothetical protein